MKIILGAAQFGSSYGIANRSGKVSDEDIRKILKEAIKYGVDTIDTAVNYGDSERRLGKNNLNKFKVISKLPSINKIDTNDLQKWILESVNNSLSQLKVNKLEALLLHRPQELLSDKGYLIIKALDYLKKNNLINKTGISIYDPNELPILFDKYKFELVQSPLNIMDRRIIESGWLEKLKDNNVEVHARSIFLQGLLLMEYKDLKNDFFKKNKFLRRWFDWLQINNLSPYESSLEFIKTNQLIDKFLIGVDNFNQFQELLENYKADNYKFQIPNFKCDDQNLLNPSKWPIL